MPFDGLTPFANLHDVFLNILKLLQIFADGEDVMYDSVRIVKHSVIERDIMETLQLRHRDYLGRTDHHCCFVCMESFDRLKIEEQVIIGSENLARGTGG